MKKVLLITYYWPPASGPGVQRWLKFAKYLPEFGWQPTILTVKDGSYPFTDASLLNDIPANMTTHRTRTLEPFALYNKLKGQKGKAVEIGSINQSKNYIQRFANYIRANYFIPDARIGWKHFAIRQAKKMIQQENISTIITTGPPHSTHLVGLALKQQLGVHWLADFRDPWTKLFYNKYLPRTVATQKRDQYLENTVVQQADILVTVSQGMAEEFKDRATVISAIYNGFDETDILQKQPKKTKQFTLAYIGNLKSNQNTTTLWQILADLKQEIPHFSQHFVLNFTGNLNQEVQARLQQYQLTDIIQQQGFVAHHKATQLMGDANLLFFPIPQAPNNQYIITGKIFEYLASRTPILGIGPIDGNAADMLRICKRMPMLDYEDHTGIRSNLLQAYQHWQQNGQVSTKITTDEHFIFNRRSLTKQLAQLLDTLG